MTSRRDPMLDKKRMARRAIALWRPELSHSDGQRRAAPASPISAPIKVIDDATRALIDAALQIRGDRGNGGKVPA